MIVIPLVVASIILGMTSSRDMAQLRSMGLRSGLFFLFITVVAAMIGVLVALAVEPGAYLQAAQLPVSTATDVAGSAAPSLSTLPAQIVRVVPTNPLQASVEQNMLQVVVLAVGASIGSPGTPGIGIVILSMMLGTVGIPAEGIALIIGVDRVLDMSRTTLNVAGDLVAASVIDQHTPRSNFCSGTNTSSERPTQSAHWP